jgi:hypothetical protein
MKDEVAKTIGAADGSDRITCKKEKIRHQT